MKYMNKFSIKDFFLTFIAALVVFFFWKYPFMILVKANNWNIWIYYICSSLSSCIMIFIASQLKESESEIGFVRLFTIFLISLLSIVFFPSFFLFLFFLPELITYLEPLLFKLWRILEILTPINTAYADSPEPEDSSNNSRGDSNNRSRSRSPSLIQRIDSSYRERSPTSRMPPMSSRVARPLTPTGVNEIQLPVLPRSPDMNGIDLSDITENSVFKTEAFIDGPKITEGAMAGRTTDGYLPRQHLFDLPTTPHKYNEAHAWFERCTSAEGDYFSSKQIAYRILLVSLINGTMVSEYNMENSRITTQAAERLASYHFKQKYDDNSYFLS